MATRRNADCHAQCMNKPSLRTVNFLGHPVHQMLVAFPTGLLLTSVLVDVAGRMGFDVAPRLAHSLLGLGLLSVLAAAPFGWLDWRRIPMGTRARHVGAIHGIGNVVALLLFAAHWFMRDQGFAPTWVVFLSVIAGACMVGTAWMGAELVTRMGMGVHAGAHLDAPGSLLVESDRECSRVRA